MSIEQYQQLGFKPEVTELTPIALSSTDYDIAWHGEMSVKPVSDMNERRVRRASFGPLQPVGGAYIGEVMGTFEPVPSGTDGTAPKWFQLLAASGATVTGDVATWGTSDLIYAAKGTPLTFIHKDGAWACTAAGARVETLNFKADKGGLWLCEMTAKGRYSQATDTAFVAMEIPPINGKAFLGHAVTIGGVAASIASIEIAITNVISPVEDGTHISGYGKNVITEQRCTFKASVVDTGIDYFSRVRNDAETDVLDISCQMSTGAAGNVLTWIGTIGLMEDAATEFREGNGFVNISGEFVATTAGAILTLTQS